ncbi:peptidylprolyl isomerase [Sulfurospirillum arcachonense]|uniref:peptidylprolyl isomerase n=1 Tax=Sulfurospirillum arcachonense TaxID=57666 RepID=UPI00046A1B84|nr:peptidylprolyl isomerase [Sulfurospirillum arcachonense]
MNIISRLFLSASVCVTLGFSGIITGVSVIINNEPITLYEVYKYSEQYKISKKEALNVLVRQKLENSQIKKLNIDADIFEIDQFIENLANKNGLSQYEFLNMLKSKNINIDDYKQDVKTKIKQEKLYGRIFKEKLKAIEENELNDFYKKNPSKFKVANSFSVNIYTSQNANDLKAIQKNPMLQPESVKIENKILTSNILNNKLNAVLNDTREGLFTHILTVENIPTMFYIKEKKDLTVLPFEQVKNSIYNMLSKQQEKQVIDEYFEKMKSSASIKVVRSPA